MLLNYVELKSLTAPHVFVGIQLWLVRIDLKMMELPLAFMLNNTNDSIP